MKSILNDIIDNYKSLKLNVKEEYFNFFKNWSQLHVELFTKIGEENFENFDEINKNFMNKRSRMVSAQIQKIKLKIFHDEEINGFKEVLKNHDEIFKELLGNILNYYSEELIKVQRFRKVTAAYVQCHGG